jgi:hypothetical protein
MPLPKIRREGARRVVFKRRARSDVSHSVDPEDAKVATRRTPCHKQPSIRERPKRQRLDAAIGSHTMAIRIAERHFAPLSYGDAQEFSMFGQSALGPLTGAQGAVQSAARRDPGPSHFDFRMRRTRGRRKSCVANLFDIGQAQRQRLQLIVAECQRRQIELAANHVSDTRRAINRKTLGLKRRYVAIDRSWRDLQRARDIVRPDDGFRPQQ